MTVYTSAMYAEEIARTFRGYPVPTVAGTAAAQWVSFWTGATPPSGGRALDMTADGAALPVSATEVRRLGFLKMPAAPGNIFVYDRLVDSSGLVANVNTLQSFSYPSLPRYADGDLVEAFLEVNTTWTGSTASNLTVNYTNQAGDPKSAVTPMTGTIGSPVKRLLPLCLAVGDRGFRSVQSVQFDNAYSTSGNFGIVLARRILWIPQASSSLTGSAPPYSEVNAFRGALPKFLANACPWLTGLTHTTTAGGTILGYSLLETQ